MDWQYLRASCKFVPIKSGLEVVGVGRVEIVPVESVLPIRTLNLVARILRSAYHTYSFVGEVGRQWMTLTK